MKNTIGFFELEEDLREQQDKINQKLHDKAFTEDRYVVDYIKFNRNFSIFSDNKIVNIEVNWCCIGATTPEKAMAFAEALLEASEVAKNYKYNGYTVEY